MPFQQGGEVELGNGGFQPAARPGVRQAQDMTDAVIAGMQSSSLGLALRGKLPTQALGTDAPWYQRLAYSASNIAGDIPAGVAGFVAGGAAGTAVAGPPGSIVGAGAGSFGLPMALREGMMAAYANDHAMSWDGVWQIAKASLVGGAKGAAIGAATLGAGAVAARTVGGAIAADIGTSLTVRGATRAIGAAQVGTELAALTGTAAALEGHMPTAQDFIDNAILLGGMKAAGHVATGMRGIFAETGKRPAEVLADSVADPTIKADLLAGGSPAAYAPLALEQKVKAALDSDPRPEIIRQALAPTEESAVKFAHPEADPVKYEYIGDTDTAKAVLHEVAGMYDKEILSQTRGQVTNTETAAAAVRMLTAGDVADRIVGQAGNASEIYARAHMLRGATNHAVAELAKLADVPAAELTPQAKITALAAIERVSMLYSEFSGVAAEVGRALQIFRRLKYDGDFLGEAKSLIDAAEKKGDLQSLARLVKELKDPAQAARFFKEYQKATGWEMTLEGWKAAVLSGPQTHIANIMGNLGKWLIEIPESAAAASLHALDSAAKGQPLNMGQFKARALAPIYGIQFGAKDALHVAAEAWRHDNEISKLDTHRGDAIPGKAGDIIRTPFKALRVEDAVPRMFAERAEANIMAVDRATREGNVYGTREWDAAVAKYRDEPTLGMTDKEATAALDRIQQAGGEAVFSQRLGPRMEGFSRAIAGTPLELIIPFRRTPVNIMSWVFQHVPGLNLTSGRWRADWEAGGEQRTRAIARQAMGFGLAATAYSLSQSGLLSGGGQFDKEEGGVKRAAGWQPYSVNVNGTWYSYQRMEPVGKVIGLAADLVELQAAAADKGDKAKMGIMLAAMLGNATVSTTYLSGVSSTINVVTDPGRYSENFMEQYASSLVPKVLGQTAAGMDPYKREVDGMVDAIQSQIPFVREKLLPKRDVWGEPVKNDKWFDVMPVAVSKEAENKVATEAQRLQLAIADVSQFANEKGPLKPGEKRIELTPEQRDIVRQVRGQEAMRILAPIVNADDWRRIPDFAQAAIIKGVVEKTGREGLYKALPADDAARVELRHQIVNKIIAEQQAAQNR